MREKRNCVICAVHQPEPIPLHPGRNKSLNPWEIMVRVGSQRSTCSAECSSKLGFLQRQAWQRLPSSKAKAKIYDQKLEVKQRRKELNHRPDRIEYLRKYNLEYRKNPINQVRIKLYSKMRYAKKMERLKNHG